MLHSWSLGTDGNGATVRTLLLDYRKAFDLIDHSILVRKLRNQCKLLASIINWIIDFLSDRSQRIKFASECFSEWGPVPAGVPQGTKLGPWLFVLMINELDTNAQQWKYVDDTTVSEVVVKGGESHVQAIANRVIEWSHENRVQLNADKCKELRISFAKEQRVFDPIIIEGKEVELVTSTRLLGLTIANDLTWNDHVTEITKKASKRLYFLTQFGSSQTRSSTVLRIVCEICYWLCSTCLFQRSPPVLKERAGTAREKSSINNNLWKVQLGNWGGVNTHFGALLRIM